MSLLLVGLLSTSYVLELEGDTAGMRELFDRTFTNSRLSTWGLECSFSFEVVFDDPLASMSLRAACPQAGFDQTLSFQGERSLLVDWLEEALFKLAERLKEMPISGKLTISTVPPGAGVWLDGALRGTTPLVLEDIEPERDYDIVVRLEGYYPLEERVNLGGSRELELSAELEKKGSLLSGSAPLSLLLPAVGVVAGAYILALTLTPE